MPVKLDVEVRGTVRKAIVSGQTCLVRAADLSSEGNQFQVPVSQGKGWHQEHMVRNRIGQFLKKGERCPRMGVD